MKRLAVLLIIPVLLMASACNTTGRASKDDQSGLFLMRQNDKIGFMDKNGKIVIQPQFENAYNFSEGRAPVLSNDKWGFIDTSGKYIIQPQFDAANEFKNGLALVVLGGKLGYIDKGCKVIWSEDKSQALTP